MNKPAFLALIVTQYLLIGSPTIKIVQAIQPLQIAQSLWKPFSSSEGGFTVLMPGTPTKTKAEIEVGGSMPVHFYSVRNTEAIYSVGYMDRIRNFSNSNDINQFLESAMFIPTLGGGILLSQKPISLGGFTGREYRMQHGGGEISIGKMYLVNKRLYYVIAMTKNERNLTKTIKGFLNSFQLLNSTLSMK